GIRDWSVTGVQTCALPISHHHDRGFLRDLDRGCEPQDQGWRPDDWAQGWSYVESHAALVDDRRAGLWLHPRRSIDRRWREGQTRSEERRVGRGGRVGWVGE